MPADPSVATLVVRRNVNAQTDYRLYKEDLRLDFWFSCAYCFIAEVEAGGLRFTIDHYEPRTEDPAQLTSYENLFWVCDHCNMYKASTWPPKKARKEDVRFFRPDVDHAHKSFSIAKLSELLIEGAAPEGEFSVKMLRLNRKSLRTLREIRSRLASAQEHIAFGLQAMKNFPIDRLLKKDVLPQFLEHRKRLESTAHLVGDELKSAALKEINRSHLLDDDDVDDAAMKRARDAYLARKKVAFPGRWGTRRPKT